MKRTRVLVFVALLISMEVVLTRFLSIETPIVRIGFGFLPIAFSAIFFGPAIGGLTAMLADILGMMIFPKGAYFPGFTFSALVGGVIYGLFLYNKPKSLIRVGAAVLLITIFVDLGMNTLWLIMITGKTGAAILVPRLLKCAIMFPVQAGTIYMAWNYVGNIIEQHFLRKDRIA